MGYTHYWGFDGATEISPEKWRGIRRETEVLAGAFPKDDISNVRIDDDTIAFSGDCEGFYLSRTGDDRGFCKTGHGAYDKLVCAILTITAQRCNTFKLMSDAFMGEEPDGWPGSFVWASEVLGREVKFPSDDSEISADPSRLDRIVRAFGRKVTHG